MQFPLTLKFKLFSLASQIYITDANGQTLGFVKQKMFKLKEDIRILSNPNSSEENYRIKADRILDFSANYSLLTGEGIKIGSIKRKGMRSIWKAHYLIHNDVDLPVFEIKEANPWIKVIDSLIGEVPIIGMLSGYVFNPCYHITDTNQKKIATIQKKPSFFEGVFTLSPEDTISKNQQEIILLSTLMMILLEKNKG